LGELAKLTQGPIKIIDVQQLSINGTVLIWWLPTSFEHINICQLLPFLIVTTEDVNFVPQSLWPTETW
jgi:hypothetical protein